MPIIRSELQLVPIYGIIPHIIAEEHPLKWSCSPFSAANTSMSTGSLDAALLNAPDWVLMVYRLIDFTLPEDVTKGADGFDQYHYFQWHDEVLSEDTCWRLQFQTIGWSDEQMWISFWSRQQKVVNTTFPKIFFLKECSTCHCPHVDILLWTHLLHNILTSWAGPGLDICW